MKLLKIAILASGRGSVIPRIIEAIDNKQLNAEIAIIVSNKADAKVLELAKSYNIEAKHISSEQLISQTLKQHNIELILLIGYMKILSHAFVDEWRNRILNVHPSLLPAFAGLKDLNLHQAVLKAGVKETGCTVHLATEELDAGPILLQKKCSVYVTDTPQTLKQRVQKLEGEALVEAIKKWQEEYG
ncbi:MAG: phosphoribosylglycinamide formyltransferase [Hydrotalea flava]|nr:phosphoribosylglycinamide formyltransferase [Hydrotalea flava]NIO95508.1 phosphoribosylglycinamide formyltransferase [Hydrotalea flava]